MVKELKNVAWEDGNTSTVETLTLFFPQNYTSATFDKFETPKTEDYEIYYTGATNSSESYEDWGLMDVVNPKGVVQAENPTLPNFDVKIDDKVYSLHEAIKLLVALADEDN